MKGHVILVCGNCQTEIPYDSILLPYKLPCPNCGKIQKVSTQARGIFLEGLHVPDKMVVFVRKSFAYEQWKSQRRTVEVTQ